MATFENLEYPCISGAKLKVDEGRKMNIRADIEEMK